MWFIENKISRSHIPRPWLAPSITSQDFEVYSDVENWHLFCKVSVLNFFC